MLELSIEELRIHYLRRLTHIEEEMESCHSIINRIESLMTESRAGPTAESLNNKLEEIKKRQISLINEMDSLIEGLSVY